MGKSRNFQHGKKASHGPALPHFFSLISCRSHSWTLQPARSITIVSKMDWVLTTCQGTKPHSSHVWFYFHLSLPCKAHISGNLISVLQRRALILREIGRLVQRCTAATWQGWDSTPSSPKHDVLPRPLHLCSPLAERLTLCLLWETLSGSCKARVAVLISALSSASVSLLHPSPLGVLLASATNGHKHLEAGIRSFHPSFPGAWHLRGPQPPL